MIEIGKSNGPQDLEAREVCYAYGVNNAGTAQVLQGLSLHVERGTFVCMVGPSGCGKTTFLKIAAGLLQPTSGEVLLGGEGLDATRDKRAMVFQDASLFPWYTVERNAAYGLESRGMRSKEARARAQNVIAAVGLHEFAKAYPHQLSGGMKQRVNLARALAVEPSLLLMDEPFAAIDAQTREYMQRELTRIWLQSRVTVVFITHQIDEAIYLGDRVVVLSARPGRVVLDMPVNLPRPRALAVKRTTEFNEYEDKVWSAIQAGDLGGH